MTAVRDRLSLLALGILAPVLAFGAIALSGAPSAAADYYHPNIIDFDGIDDPDSPTGESGEWSWECSWGERCSWGVIRGF